MAYNYEYPYTDAHELNLDWFLARFKEYYEHITEQDQKITTMEETVGLNSLDFIKAIRSTLESYL